MIILKRERQKQRKFPFPLMLLLCIFCKIREGAADNVYKEIWDDWGCCLLPKIPTPAKENSRAWAWALQQNIMGLSFEHTQLILKHTQQSPTSFKILIFQKLGNHKMKLVLMSCGLESTLGICILEFTKSWW